MACDLSDHKLRSIFEVSVGLLITGSEVTLPLLRQASKAACLSDITVLLEGETGTGKQVLAQAIHQLDQKRRLQPFVTVHSQHHQRNVGGKRACAGMNAACILRRREPKDGVSFRLPTAELCCSTTSTTFRSACRPKLLGRTAEERGPRGWLRSRVGHRRAHSGRFQSAARADGATQHLPGRSLLPAECRPPRLALPSANVPRTCPR